MSVIVTTPEGDITHPTATGVSEWDDGSIYAVSDLAGNDVEGSVGYHAPGTFTSWRIEPEEQAVLDLSFRDAVWQVPEPGPLDEFPPPADLRPHIDALNEMAKAMTKVSDLGGEARKAYQLQQVAVALWLGLDPAVVSDLSVHYGAKSGSEEVAAVDYLAVSNAVGNRPTRPHTPLQYTIRPSLAHDDMMEVKVDLDPGQTRALRDLVGYPIPRPFPTFGKVKV